MAPDLVLTSDDFFFATSNSILLEKCCVYLSCKELRNFGESEKNNVRGVTMDKKDNITSKDRVRMRDGGSREGNKRASGKHHERIKKESMRIDLSVHFLPHSDNKVSVCATL